MSQAVAQSPGGCGCTPGEDCELCTLCKIPRKDLRCRLFFGPDAGGGSITGTIVYNASTHTWTGTFAFIAFTFKCQDGQEWLQTDFIGYFCGPCLGSDWVAGEHACFPYSLRFDAAPDVDISADCKCCQDVSGYCGDSGPYTPIYLYVVIDDPDESPTRC